MSIRALAWAWTVDATPTAKFVLVALADHADEIGLCWPSIARLRSHTGLSERGIRNAIRDLEAAGMIITETRDGHASKYRLTISGEVLPRHEMPGSEENATSHTPAPDAGEGGTSCRGGRHVVPGTPARGAPVTVKNRQRTINEPSVRRGSRLPTDWWPSSADQEFARSVGVDCVITADSFRDYWHARPGAGGVKLDWSATWRNWCRNDAKRQQPKQQAGKLDWLDTDPIFRRTA